MRFCVSGKLLSAAGPIPARESESAQNRTHPRFERVAVAGPHLVLDLMKTVSHLPELFPRRVEFAHAAGERLRFLFQRLHSGEHRHALVEHRALGELQTILGQIAQRNALGENDRALVERLGARQDAQQRCLPAAVGADKRAPVAARDQPVEIFE